MKELIRQIVRDAEILKDKYTDQKNIPVNYACIFCRSPEEEKEFLKQAHDLGKIIQETKSGPLFKINIETMAGKLQLLKIREPDISRTERGDADFTVKDYLSFKQKYLGQPGFSLIQKDGFEMIELYKVEKDVRVYFSFPPLDKQLKLVK